MPRPVPSRVSDLKVPNLNYDYFCAHGSQRFPATTAEFCPTTAWWLMECSLCSYLPDQRSITRHLSNAGFTNIAFCEANKLRAVAADLGTNTFIIFRGTLFSEIANVITDLAMKRQPWPGGGRVHTGFHEGFLALLPAVKKTMASRLGQQFWFTGHSLGGALATLFAAHFPATAPCYTFGSPRTGDAAFGQAFCAKSYRCVLGRDIVSTLPPKPLYRHVVPSHRLTTEGKITFEGHDKHRTPAEIIGEVRRQARKPRDLARYLLTNNIIADHAPVLYCIGLWNAIND